MTKTEKDWDVSIVARLKTMGRQSLGELREYIQAQRDAGGHRRVPDSFILDRVRVVMNRLVTADEVELARDGSGRVFYRLSEKKKVVARESYGGDDKDDLLPAGVVAAQAAREEDGANFISSQETAKRLSVSASTLRNLINARVISGTKRGRKLLFDSADVERVRLERAVKKVRRLREDAAIKRPSRGELTEKISELLTRASLEGRSAEAVEIVDALLGPVEH